MSYEDENDEEEDGYGDEDEEDANYLYKKDVYNPDEDSENKPAQKKEEKKEKSPVVEDGYELPDFLGDDDDVIKIKDDD